MQFSINRPKECMCNLLFCLERMYWKYSYLYNTTTRRCEVSGKIVKYNRSLGQGLLFRHHANWLV